MTYSEKLKDPKWQKKRLEIFERDHWTCQGCLNDKETLHVHHMIYENVEPWEAHELTLITVCETCHSIFHLNKEPYVSMLFMKLWFIIWLRQKELS